MTTGIGIADLHVGSLVGLALDEHNLTIPSKIFKRYREAVKANPRPKFLIVNGDAIEGQNKKKTGFGTWTTDLIKQIEEAAELIDMWQAEKVFIVRGSPYHVAAGNTGMQCEEWLARKVKNAVPYPGDDPKARSGWHWYITIEGITIHVSHKIPFSKVFHYKSTPLAKEMLFEKLNSMLRHDINEYKTSLVLRAHGHSYMWLEYSRSAGCVLPCWKAVDEFAEENGAISFSPDLGYVKLSVDGDTLDYQKNLFHLDEVQPAPHYIMSQWKRKTTKEIN
jgi:hypothetical protein